MAVSVEKIRTYFNILFSNASSNSFSNVFQAVEKVIFFSDPSMG